jgi:hypothetical protein
MHDDDPAFHFDKVFAPDCKQEDVFGAVLNDSVSSVLEGFNATVLAYGQTGAGKTYKCAQPPPPPLLAFQCAHLSGFGARI